MAAGKTVSKLGFGLYSVSSLEVKHCVSVYWLYKGVCQWLNVVSVQVGCGLIQGQDPTVQTEGLCQSETDDQGCQHLDPRLETNA